MSLRADETSIEYIVAMIAAHKMFHNSRSYVPTLAGRQRDYLDSEGYIYGVSLGQDCCWFQKAQV